MNSRREKVDSLGYGPEFHAGLWLDRYIKTLGEKGEAKQDHLDALIKTAAVPTPYLLGFPRWREMILASPPHTAWAEVTAVGRVAVGLGADSVLETSLALHHTYGVPYLPASGLKGLAAATAHQRAGNSKWRKARLDQPAGEAFRTLFGDTDSSGHVTFHDGLLIPEASKKTLPLPRDVMTVHHPLFYQGSGEEAPTEWDDPTPIAFLSTRGKYLVAVTGPESWAKAGLANLLEGFRTLGAGAKTFSGYGRLRVVRSSLTEPVVVDEGERPPRPPVVTRVFREREPVELKVERIEGRFYVLIECETSQEVKHPATGQGWGVGQSVRLRIRRVGGDGLIKQVGP